MDLLRPEDVHELLEDDGSIHVSIYQPTHRAGPDGRQDPIRLKNLLREAQRRLQAAGLRDGDAGEILKPAADLLEDTTWWQHQGDGLAVFCAPGRFDAYRLPLAFDELVHVDRRFHVKPLLPLFTSDRRFYVLAVSQNETRVFTGSRQRIETLELGSIPHSLAEAMKFEGSEKQLQWHTGAGRGEGRRAAVFHGHGTPDENAKDRILRYFRQIDQGLHEILREERAPLVLAAVEYYAPIYREANTYTHLLEEGLPGNPERVRPGEMHAKAWAIVEAHFLTERAAAGAAVEQALGKGHGSADLAEVLSLAEQGRIETLFIASDETRWGRLDPDGNISLSEEPGQNGEDLLDRAAVRTLRFGGRVYPIPREQLPGQGLVASSLRG